MTYQDRNFNVTASIGVSSVRPGSLEKDTEIVRKADEALYDAKMQGRNRVVVSPMRPKLRIM